MSQPCALPIGMRPSAPSMSMLDVATHVLFGEISSLPDHEPVDVPQGLARVFAGRGKSLMTLSSSAFRARGIASGRCVKIEGPGLWGLHVTAAPEDGFGIPILNIEILALRGKVQLVTADLFPVVRADDDIMLSVQHLADQLGEADEIPDGGAKIFSSHPILRRPGTSAAILPTVQVVRSIAQRWNRCVVGAMPIRDQYDATIAALSRDQYLWTRRERVLDTPFMQLAFGGRLCDRVFREVLYPVVAQPASQRRVQTYDAAG